MNRSQNMKHDDHIKHSYLLRIAQDLVVFFYGAIKIWWTLITRRKRWWLEGIPSNCSSPVLTSSLYVSSRSPCTFAVAWRPRRTGSTSGCSATYSRSSSDSQIARAAVQTHELSMLDSNNLWCARVALLPKFGQCVSYAAEKMALPFVAQSPPLAPPRDPHDIIMV